MNTDHSYTADATSDLSDRLKEAVSKSAESIQPERSEKLQRVQKRVDDLKSRGLLKKQEFVRTTTAEFERRYCK